MKNHASIYLASLISITATAACLAGDTPAANPAPAVASSAPAVVTPASPATPALPHAVGEVVKMYQGGISKEILVSYVNNSSLPFRLTADGIIYLQHLGMPQEVTAAMIHRDGELQKEGAAAYQQPPPGQPAPAGTPPPAVAVPGTPPPAVNPYPQVITQPVYPDYDVYAYPYPYYYYPYYGPNIIVGGGWGWGHGWHGGWGGHGGFHH